MAQGDEKIELRLVARADLGDVARTTHELQKIDKETEKLVASNKRLAEATKQAAKEQRNLLEEMKRSVGTPIRDPRSTLASSSGIESPSQRAARLRAEERAAGLETERQMRAEDEAVRLGRRAAAEAQKEERKRAARDAQAAQVAAQENARKQARYAEIDRNINARAEAQRNRQAAELQQAQSRTQAEIARRRSRTANFINDQSALRARNQAARDAGLGALDVAENAPINLSTIQKLLVGGGIGALVGKSLKEFSGRDSADRGLAASLAGKGVLNAETFGGLRNLAESKRQELGGKSADWVETIGGLIAAGGKVSEIDKLTTGVENLAGIMGGNVPNAAKAMEKAIQGNFDQLKEWGVLVPENATQAQKLESAMKSLAERGAGLLKNRSEGLAGQWDKLKESGNNLLANLAGTFTRSELLKQSLSGLGFVVQKLANFVGGATPPITVMNQALAQSSRVLTEAENAARNASKEFNSITQSSDRAAQALNRQRSAAEQLRDAQDSIASARLGLQIANIDAAEHSGRMSPQQANLARANARMSFEQQRFTRAQAADTETQSAAERRLNQMGTQRGMLEAQHADLTSRVQSFRTAHANRALASDAENRAAAAEAALAEMRNRPSASAAAMSGGQVGMMGPFRNEAEERRLAEAAQTARSIASQARARAGESPLSDDEGAQLQQQLAQVTTALVELRQVIQREAPGLQDTASTARLNRDTRGIQFGLNQQTENVQLRDQISQTPIASNDLAALRAQLNPSDQVALVAQLRQALQLRNDAMTAGFVEIVNGINADIRNINAQLRTLGTRR